MTSSVEFKSVAIIGSGAMGTVCSLILAERGLAVRMWGAFPEYLHALQRDRENRRYLPGYAFPPRLNVVAEDRLVFDGVDLIVSAIPCQFLRGVWNRLTPWVPAAVPIVSVSKGIENTTLFRPTQIISAMVGDNPVAALSGPSIAPEVAAKQPTTVVAAADDLDLAERIQHVFNTPYFRVYTNPDLLGVEIAGATKNVIALAAGMVDGLKAGDNAKAALLTRGLVEISRLGLAMGAHAETFSGLAGVGDLVTTCISPVGRNRTAGERIGQGTPAAQVVATTSSVIEGIATTRSVVELAREYNVQMPITSAVHAVLFENMPPRTAIEHLMTRQLKSEK